MAHNRIGNVLGRVLLQHSFVARECSHLDSIQQKAPGWWECRSCRDEGTASYHLRMCLVCGEVGCCDDSQGRHATRHFQQTGHPLIRSIEAGEHWVWCYEDHAYLGDVLDRGDVVTTDLASDTRLPTSLRVAGPLSAFFGIGAAAIMAVTLAFLVIRGQPPSPWGPLNWGRGGFLEDAGINAWRTGVAVAMFAASADILIGRQLLHARRRAGYWTLAKLPVDIGWVVGVGIPLIGAAVYSVRLLLVMAGWRHLRPRRT